MTATVGSRHELQRERFELDRPRLTSIAADASHLTITAPSGYGKTTLLRQISAKLDYPFLWITCSEDGRDVRSFTNSVARAAHVAFPDLPLQNYAALQDVNTTGDRFILNLAEAFNLYRPVHFIFDNSERLKDEGFRWLLAFIGELHEKHQVIIAQRPESPIKLEEALPEAQHLDQEHLAFNAQETHQLAQLASSSVSANELQQDSQGWPLITMMAVKAGTANTPLQDLATRFVDDLPPSIRQALPSLAVLDVWTQDSPKDLGFDVPDDWAHHVLKSGLPIKANSDKTLIPHAFTLELLEAELARDPETQRQQHKRAAQIAENSGLWLSAIKHLRFAGEHAHAVNLLAELSVEWQQRSEWTLLRSVLEPFDFAQLTPQLATLLGVSIMETGDPDQGKAILETIVETGQSTQWTYFGLALYAYRQAETHQGHTYIESGLTRPGNRYETIRLLEAKAALLFQSCFKRANARKLPNEDLNSLLDVGQQAMNWAQSAPDPFSQVAALTTQALAKRTFGKLKRLPGDNYIQEVRSLAMQAVDIANNTRMPHRTLAALEIVRVADFALGRTQESFPLLCEALELFKKAYPLGVPWMNNALAQHYLATGQYTLAKTHLLEAVQTGYGAINDIITAHLDLVQIHCALGDVADAKNQQAIVDDLIREHQFEGFDRGFAQALIALYTGDYDHAQTLFNRVISDGEEYYPSYCATEHLAYAFKAEIARREGTLTKQHIDDLCNYCQRYPGDWILRRDINTFRELFAYAIAQGWRTNQLRSYLVGLAPERPTEKPFMDIRTLGQAIVLLDGNELPLSQSQLEILVFIALHSQTTADQISINLWPAEDDVDLRQRKLQKILNQLRSILGRALGIDGKRIIAREATGHYRFSDAVHVVLDCTTIKQAFQESDELEMHLQALRTYQGDFLPDHYNDWVLEYRNNLSERVAHYALATAARLETYSTREAVEFYALAGTLDDLNIHAFQAQERLFTSVGDHARAHVASTHIQRINQGMTADLGPQTNRKLD